MAPKKQFASTAERDRHIKAKIARFHDVKQQIVNNQHDQSALAPLRKEYREICDELEPYDNEFLESLYPTPIA